LKAIWIERTCYFEQSLLTHTYAYASRDLEFR
jgi:hypothetical protein